MNKTEMALEEFAKHMKLVLGEHQEQKGDSWIDCDINFLVDKLDEEVNEFKKANRPLAKAEELIDIANICMMLHHRLIDIWAEKVNIFLCNKEG